MKLNLKVWFLRNQQKSDAGLLQHNAGDIARQNDVGATSDLLWEEFVSDVSRCRRCVSTPRYQLSMPQNGLYTACKSTITAVTFFLSASLSVIGVGDASTLGGDIFARKYMYEKCRNFTWYLSENNKIAEFYMTFARKCPNFSWHLPGKNIL